MEIIPVIDILKGIAVHAVKGERENYKPLKSIYSTTPDPLEIARNLPYDRIYIADLDAIMEGKPNIELIKKISQEKKVILDPGIRTVEDLKLYKDISISPVLGTETLESIETLRKALETFEEVFLSIDIKENRVISPFLNLSPLECFELFYEEGVENFIFLEISKVGTLSSPAYEYLDKIEGKAGVFVGGGVRKEDIERLKKKRVSGVLVGTALHRGLF